MIKISPARISAWEILTKIESEKSYSSILLPKFEKDLGERDRALCHELTLGILRKQIFLDRAIEHLTGKKIAKFDIEVVVALRLGLYQLLFLDKIPTYSAINESVNLVHRARKKSAAGLVNAVLRRASREKIELPEPAAEIDKISIETSHPAWLITRWADQFGLEEAAKIARGNNNSPRIAFRLTARFYARDAEKRRRIMDEINSLNPELSEVVEGCFIIESSNKRIFELAETGDIYFQDEGSQMVSSAVNLQAGENFLDVCAAPGSKVTQIAAVREQDAQSTGLSYRPTGETDDLTDRIRNLIVAGDFHAHRIRKLRENCVKQGIGEIVFTRYDAEAAMPFRAEFFDAVLVDAPCSGTGTIRHNPEIRYFLSPTDIDELALKQLKLLSNASKLVKRGGRIIYSTCSLEKEENEEVVFRFLNQNPSFSTISASFSQDLIGSDGFIRTFPHRDGFDGFFVAVFEKRHSFG